MPRYLHGVDTYALPGEPVFTLRAQDRFAPRLVRLWVWLASRRTGPVRRVWYRLLGRPVPPAADPVHMWCVLAWADEMDAWRDAHGGGKWPHAPMNPDYQRACREDREAT